MGDLQPASPPPVEEQERNRRFHRIARRPREIRPAIIGADVIRMAGYSGGGFARLHPRDRLTERTSGQPGRHPFNLVTVNAQKLVRDVFGHVETIAWCWQ